MELIHGGDWAGYRARLAMMRWIFRPMSARWACRRAWRMPSLRHCPLRTAIRTPFAGSAHGTQPGGTVPEPWILCGNGAADLIFRLVLALSPAVPW